LVGGLAMNTSDSVSVIIPVLNEAETIGELLSDLEKQQAHIAEILVVDGGSQDNTEAVLATFPHATLLKSPKANVAFQRNVGAQKAKSTWLLFLDADSRIDQSAIQNMLREMKRRKLDIGCPLFKPMTQRRSLQMTYQVFNAFFVLFEKVVPSGGGMGIVVKKSVFDKASGFDESLTYEDIAFIRRASRMGKFGILSEKIGISVRRFEKQGSARVVLKYLVLSLFFITGQFRLANRIKYSYDYRT
jgi:glycosyltransferase involved in cell wall biosynthesis